MKVDVIVPLYRGKKYIDSIIRMVENNSNNVKDTEVELIFVNDCPEEVISNDDIGSTLVRVHIIHNENNLGIHASRINGLLYADGDYIVFLDQDDRISDTFIKSQLSHMMNADVVVSNGFEQHEDYSKCLYKCSFMQWTVKCMWFYTKYGNRIISPGQCLIRRTSIPEKWIESPLVNNGSDDYMLWLLMLSRKRRFAINREYQYIHVYTSCNLSLDKEKMSKSVLEMVDYVKDEIKEHNTNMILNRVNKNKQSRLIRTVEYVNRIR